MSPQTTPKRKSSQPSTSQKKLKTSISLNHAPQNDIINYNKTHATGGYCGNDYEIKLSALIWLNLKYDDDIKDFLLATNVMVACPLDDIYFKIKWKDENRKPTIVFIQLKHKINDEKPSIKMDQMFSAYEKIKKIMDEEEETKRQRKDYKLFEGKFDEYKCFSILYTNKDFTLKTDPVTHNNYWSKLNDIFGTSGSVRELREEEMIKIMRKNNRTWNEDELNAFVKSLLIFSRQADEMGVEEIILTEHVDKQSRTFINPFPLEPHPVTLTFIRMFVDWWKEMKRPYCFTKKDDLLENAFKAVLKSPWLSTLNILYTSKIHYGYEFTDDAVSSLNLHHQDSSTVITTENSALTALKVLQHLKNKDYAVLDLKRIAGLQYGQRKALCEELKTNEQKVIILVCDEIPKNETFKDIEEAVKTKKLILISNNNETSQKLKDFFPVCEGEAHRTEHDNKNRLADMTAESQSNILENTTVIFQDKEVDSAVIIDEKSKKYVKGDILYKIFKSKTITIGNLFLDSKYDEIKRFWIDRRVNYESVKNNQMMYHTNVPLKTLKDAKDDIVILTAGPGMGKSTLLTHLSIKTKERSPKVWILRINLLENSNAFAEWQQDETTVDLIESLKFMCRVLLHQKLGNGDHRDLFTLDIKDCVVYLKHCTLDPQIEFELNMFLHFYNDREVIFLFDGFDEICSLYSIDLDYSDVVIRFLKAVSNGPQKHKMWITSRKYDEVKIKLAKEFSLKNSPYEMENLTEFEIERYLKLFWEYHLKVEELNNAELDNVMTFLEYVLSVSRGRGALDRIHGSLDWVLDNAAFYLSYTIKHTQIPLWRYNRNYHREIFVKTLCAHHELTQTPCGCCACYYCFGSCWRCNPRDLVLYKPTVGVVNPLILYLAAVGIAHNIKKVHKSTEKWYINFNDCTVYKTFLEKTIERQFQEKNENEISKPKNKIAYKKEVASSISKHKKLAAYSIFNYRSDELFTEEDLIKIKKMIEDAEKGEEANGLIDRVANGVPIFTQKSFAELFAVEYICDCLKIEDVSEKKIFLYFDLVFKVHSFDWSVTKIFGQKLEIDKTFASAVENKKDVIFKWMKNKNWITNKLEDMYNTSECFVLDAVQCVLSNISQTKHQAIENVVDRFFKCKSFATAITMLGRRHSV